MRRYSVLGFVISLHLAIFAAGVYPPNDAAGLAFGTGSVLVLAVSLFYEVGIGGRD